jgi:hypothetical protein
MAFTRSICHSNNPVSQVAKQICHGHHMIERVRLEFAYRRDSQATSDCACRMCNAELNQTIVLNVPPGGNFWSSRAFYIYDDEIRSRSTSRRTVRIG